MTLVGIIDQLACGIITHYGLEASDLAEEAALLKGTFAHGDLEAPTYTRG